MANSSFDILLSAALAGAGRGGGKRDFRGCRKVVMIRSPDFLLYVV